MKDREDFFFRLVCVLGFLTLVLFVALVVQSCSSTASVEIVRSYGLVS